MDGVGVVRDSGGRVGGVGAGKKVIAFPGKGKPTQQGF